MTKFLYRNLRGRRVLLSLAVTLTFLQAASSVLIAFPLKWILDKLVNGRDPGVPLSGRLIGLFDGLGHDAKTASGHTVFGVIAFASLVFFVLGLIGAAASWGQLSIASRIARELGARLRSDLFRHLGTLRLAWHDRQRTGDLVQRISGNITEIEKLVADGLVDLLSGVLTLVGMIVVLFILNWQFTLISMVIVPPLFVVVAVYTRTIKAASKATARAAGQVAEVATESVAAITELKAFTLEDWSAQVFQRRVDEQRDAFGRAGRLQAQFSPWVLVLVALSNLAIISLGSWVAAGNAVSLGLLSIPAGSLTVGSLTVFLTYSKQLYQPMRDLSKLMLLASNGAVACDRIQEMLDQEPEPARASHGGATTVDPVRGDVEYHGVCFGYDEGRPVLHSVDLSVPVGKRVALVGLSGSGKTTLVKLLPRFYEQWAGSITIGGRDTGTFTLPELRRSIGFVLQDSVLFEGAIRDNIAIGRSDATDEEIVVAAQKASIHDLVMSLPDGYDAQVREHGKNFSSGQRQRIAIARAIVRDAPILILDEPTANLDVEAEAEVMRALEELAEGRTVLVISHRLSTLGQVDEIAVLDRGHIVERGPYGELAARDGRFARMLAQQSKYTPAGASAHGRRSRELARNGRRGQGRRSGSSKAHGSRVPSAAVPVLPEGVEPVAAMDDAPDLAVAAGNVASKVRRDFDLTFASVRFAYPDLPGFETSALTEFFTHVQEAHAFETFEQNGSEGAELRIGAERSLTIGRRSVAYHETGPAGIDIVATTVSDLVKEVQSRFGVGAMIGPDVNLRVLLPLHGNAEIEGFSAYFREHTLNIETGQYGLLESSTSVGTGFRFVGTTEDPHTHFSFLVEPNWPDEKQIQLDLDVDYAHADPIGRAEEAGARVLTAYAYLCGRVVPFVESFMR